MLKTNRIRALTFITICHLSHAVYPAAATTTFSVTATVVGACTVTIVTPLAFGNYTSVINNATGTIAPSCSPQTSYSIGLSVGNAPGATATTRQMQNGSNMLSYALYQDSNHTIYWGNTLGTDTSPSVIGDGHAQPVTVYGEIPAGQTPTPGAYSDTITVTVYY